MESEFDAGYVEDETCENCKWWDLQEEKCYCDGYVGCCWESRWEDGE